MEIKPLATILMWLLSGTWFNMAYIYRNDYYRSYESPYLLVAIALFVCGLIIQVYA